MLRDALNLIETMSLTLNFISCFLIFLGGGYIALHSRVIPKWAVTSLWYIGLAALLNAITIIVEWTIGQMHPLSHFQIGDITETLLMLMMATTVGLLFFHTVWQDYLGSRKRSQDAALAAKKALGKRTPVARKTRAVNKKNNNYLEI